MCCSWSGITVQTARLSFFSVLASSYRLLAKKKELFLELPADHFCTSFCWIPSEFFPLVRYLPRLLYL